LTGGETTDWHPLVTKFARNQQAKGSNNIQGYKVAGQSFIQHLADEKAVTSVDDGDFLRVTEDDVEDWLRELNIDYPDSTVKTRFYNVRSFLGFLEDAAIIDEDPSADISISDWIGKRGVTRTQRELAAKDGVVYIEQEDFERLLEHVPQPRGRNLLLLRLMWQTGIRASEACKIRLSDINRDDRHIRIRTSKRDGHNRDVWWQPSLDLQMRRWIDADRGGMLTSDSPYLFITRYSEKMDSDRPNKVVTKAAENAGMQEIKFVDAGGFERQKITAHVLRHSFAVHFVRDSVGSGSGDIKTLRDLLGHASISTTEKYLRFKSETKKDKMRRYGPE
jgi:integrase/recombinase XerD